MNEEKDNKEKPQADAKQSPGPDPERVKIDMPWEEAMGKAIRKQDPKPEKG